jgi:hypothetical protein
MEKVKFKDNIVEVAGVKPVDFAPEREKLEIARIISESEVATKDNKWLALKINTNNFERFRSSFNRAKNKYNKLNPNSKRSFRFKCEDRENGEYLIWRLS